MAHLIGGERRMHSRYQLALPLRFEFRSTDGSLQAGQGVTSDLSSGGLLFVTECERPPNGAEIELSIEWPHLLQGVCPLEIYARGKVLESSVRGVVVAPTSRRFRTRGNRSFEENAYTPSISLVA